MLTVTLKGDVLTRAPNGEGRRWVFSYTLTAAAEHRSQAIGAIALARAKFEDWTLPGVDRHTPGLYGRLTEALLPPLADYLSLLLPLTTPLVVAEDGKRVEKLSWRSKVRRRAARATGARNEN